MSPSKDLQIKTVKIKDLKSAKYNPRSWSDGATAQLTESIKRFGFIDPAIVNSAPNRKNVVIGAHFRIHVAKKLGIKEIPVVYVDIPDEAKEKELNIRLNKNLGDWDFSLLAEFDEAMLDDVGFDSEELDVIFDVSVDEPSEFNLEKELEKLKIDKINAKKGDVYQLGDSRLMVGDSTVDTDFKN